MLETDSDAAYQMLRTSGPDVLCLGTPDRALLSRLLNEADRALTVVSPSEACLEAATLAGAKAAIRAELADEKWSQRLSGQTFDVLLAAIPAGDLAALDHAVRPALEQYLLSESAAVVLIFERATSTAQSVTLAPSGIRCLVESLDVTVEEVQLLKPTDPTAPRTITVKGRVSPQTKNIAAESELRIAKRQIRHERAKRRRFHDKSSKLEIQQRQLTGELEEVSEDADRWRRKHRTAKQCAADAERRAANAEQRAATAERRLSDMRDSRSWKIGRMVTALPRRICSWLPGRK